MLKALDIVLSQQPPIYFPGQYVEGVVIVHNTEPMKVRSIKVSFLGYSQASLEDPGPNISVIVTTESEKHLDETIVAWGDVKGPEIMLEAGKHQFNFQFKIPFEAKLPSSFEYRTSHIRYEILATVDRPWKSDYLSKIPFTFLKSIDINKSPFSQSPTPQEAETTICCLCCTSGPITLKGCINRNGYCPGELIKLDVECINNSGTDMEGIQARLYRSIAWTVKGRTRILDNIYCKLTSEPVKAEQNVHWNPAITVPVLAPCITNSKLVKVTYKLEVSLTVLSGDAIELKFPITIGTVPFDELLHSSQNQPQPSDLPPPAIPPSYEASQDAVSFDYQESVDGAFELRKLDSNHYVTYKLSFAPRYPCVNNRSFGNEPTSNQPTESQLEDNAVNVES